MRHHLFLSLLSVALLFAPAARAAPDWNAVAQALGKSGAEAAGGVYRVGLPRTDLTVKLGDITLKPSFALGSWLAFMPMGERAMVMGDLVLTEDEVNPVMKQLRHEGIQVTALHNHVFHAAPVTMYMHVYAEGDPVALARSFHTALALSRTPLTGTAAAAPPPAMDLNTASINAALGATGNNAGGVYQVTIARRDPVRDHGMAMPVSMGASEAINFQPLGGGRAAITGDFMLTADEVNPVISALRDNDIEVTALHNHMLNDEPRLFFMHFWAANDLPRLLTGLRAALDKVAVQRR
jgi:hypothetical protein